MTNIEVTLQPDCPKQNDRVSEMSDTAKHNKPTEYHRLIQGIFSLRKLYSDYKINAACKRADMFGCYSYKSVKRICEDGLFETSNNTDISVTGGGYGNDLRVYDELIGGAK